MRKSTWLAAMASALALIQSASAQSNPFAGPRPSEIKNVPIDTNKSLVYTPQAQLTNPQPFSLTRFFKGLFSNSSKPIVGSNNMPKGPKPGSN